MTLFLTATLLSPRTVFVAIIMIPVVLSVADIDRIRFAALRSVHLGDERPLEFCQATTDSPARDHHADPGARGVPSLARGVREHRCHDSGVFGLVNGKNDDFLS